jgi:hypothetical protein
MRSKLGKINPWAQGRQQIDWIVQAELAYIWALFWMLISRERGDCA